MKIDDFNMPILLHTRSTPEPKQIATRTIMIPLRMPALNVIASKVACRSSMVCMGMLSRRLSSAWSLRPPGLAVASL